MAVAGFLCAVQVSIKVAMSLLGQIPVWCEDVEHSLLLEMKQTLVGVSTRSLSVES